MKKILTVLALNVLLTTPVLAKEYITHIELYQISASGEQSMLTSGDITNDTDGSYSSPLKRSIATPNSDITNEVFLVSKVYKDKQDRLILNYNFELSKPERVINNQDSQYNYLKSLECYSMHQSLVMHDNQREVPFYNMDSNYILKLKIIEK